MYPRAQKQGFKIGNTWTEMYHTFASTFIPPNEWSLLFLYITLITKKHYNRWESLHGKFPRVFFLAMKMHQFSTCKPHWGQTGSLADSTSIDSRMPYRGLWGRDCRGNNAGFVHFTKATKIHGFINYEISGFDADRRKPAFLAVLRPRKSRINHLKRIGKSWLRVIYTSEVWISLGTASDPGCLGFFEGWHPTQLCGD